jgi:VWFA-related protein
MTSLATRISAIFLCSLVLASPSSVPTVERIEVRLGQFDVVVRDKHGAIVSGLGREQFTVFEDGVPMEIVGVDEWGMTSPRSAAPRPEPNPQEQLDPPTAPHPTTESERRSFVLVFDALGASTALRMNQAKRAAENFVRKHLRTDDLAAVYQLDLSLRAISGITSNADEIARGIEKVTWMAASSLQDDIAESVLSYASRGTDARDGGTDGADVRERGAATGLAARACLQIAQRPHLAVPGAPRQEDLGARIAGFPMTTAGDRNDRLGGFTLKFRELIRSLASYG